MAKGYEFDGVMPVVASTEPINVPPELAQQPTEPAPLDPAHGRKSVPASAIIARVMQDRSSFIANLTNQTNQGEK